VRVAKEGEMKTETTAQKKKAYRRPELKAVKVRPREVLGNECHSSGGAISEPECDQSACMY
jgi:hypothetical protein